MRINFNSGSVLRDLNSLNNAGFLFMQIISGRNYYTANIHQIKSLPDNYCVT